MANALAERFEPWETRADQGALLENFVWTELRKNSPPGAEIRFWRTHQGAEVDFVIVRGDRLAAVEARAGRLKRPILRRSMRRFIELHQPAHALILNRTLIAELTVGSTRVHFLPVTLFAWVCRSLVPSLFP